MNLVGTNRLHGSSAWVWHRALKAAQQRAFGFWGYFYFGEPAGGG